MAFEIKWTPRALESYMDNIAYLEREWSENEIMNFVNAVDEKIKLTALFPELFVATNRRKGIHRVVINKQVILFYRVRKALSQIELLLFWNTHQNPDNIKV